MLFSRLATALSFVGLAAANVKYAGVNEASLEFGLGVFGPPETNYPGAYDKQYTAPNTATIPYWSAQGLNAFRLCFAWERLQAEAEGPFDETYLGYLDKWIDASTSAENGHINVILDPHNYARFYGKILGSEEPTATFVDLWRKLANKYKSNPNVIFDLMNEPHDLPIDDWYSSAQAAINAIREEGAENLILVPGISWTGAHSWVWSGNAEKAAAITDPLDNFAFDMHQYFDSDYSGTSEICTNNTEVFTAATAWLKANNKKAFLGEFAVSTDKTCEGVIEDTLRYLNANSEQWIGWTWWAAGPWWGSYMYSVEPKGTSHQPQTYVLNKFFPGNDNVDAPEVPTGSITIPAPSPTPTRPVPTEQPTNDIPVFVGGSSIGAGWENWSWETTFEYTSTVGPAPLVGTNNLVATVATYGGISFKGNFFEYHDRFEFYLAAESPLFSVRFDSTTEPFESAALVLSKVCTGTFSLTSFVKCVVPVETLGWHAWDRISIFSNSAAKQTLVISNAVIHALPESTTEPTGTITATPTTTRGPLPTQTSDLPIYNGALAAAWENWSWNVVLDTASTKGPAPVVGSANLEAVATEYGGLSLKGVAFGGYKAFVFYVAGATSNWSLRFDSVAEDAEGEIIPLSTYCPGTITATKWTECKADLTKTGGINWDRFSFLSHATGEQTLYLSNIYASASGAVQTTAVPITTTSQTSSTTTTTTKTSTTTTTAKPVTSTTCSVVTITTQAPAVTVTGAASTVTVTAPRVSTTTTRISTTTRTSTTTTRTTTTTTTTRPQQCAARYGQCGGRSWTGATCCQSGSICRFSNDYYSQCL